MIVDHDGRILAQADPGPGEKIVFGPVDLQAQRADRKTRAGHHMLAHLRTEAYPVYQHSVYSGYAKSNAIPTVAENQRLIEEGKKHLNFE